MSSRNDRDDYRIPHRTSSRVTYDARDDMTPPRSTRRSASSRTSRQPARGSRDIYVGAQPSTWDKIVGALPDNVWVNRAIALVILLVIVFILFNLVTCIGGAIFPKAEDTQQAQSATQDAGAGNDQSAQSVQAVTMGGSQGVESKWTDNGRFSTGDDKLDGYIKAYCDEHTSEGATFDQAAYDTYLAVSRSNYVERANNQSPWGESWDVEFAKQFFEEGNSGSCYNFAAVTEFVLKYFGYSDAEAQPCVVKLESGAWGDHGLVFVTNKVDGKWCMIDDALSADGWMLDANSYDYDVRNINQNATVKGNVDAIDDEPMQIPPGELTETTTDGATAADGTDTTGDVETQDETSEEYATEEETYDQDATYDDGATYEEGETQA